MWGVKDQPAVLIQVLILVFFGGVGTVEVFAYPGPTGVGPSLYRIGLKERFDVANDRAIRSSAHHTA